MAAADPYEEWKEQGRPMGSFATWMASQTPAPAPASPSDTSAPTPAPQPDGGGSPFSDPIAAQEYNRLVAAGENPTTAANIVRNALFGVEHDWKEQGGDKGKLWQEGGKFGALGLSPEEAVNQYRAWEKDRMQGCPPDFPYRGREGQCAEKPDDCPDGMHVVGTPGKCVPNGPGEEDLPKGPNDKGKGSAGPPPPPPKPVTFGNQLSMTGNPLQDMLIQQFNTGQDPSTYQSNIFALGEDMKVGGVGTDADAQRGDRQAQSLSGGGLWWGQNKDAFGGFDASTKNAEGPATASPAAPKPVAEAPAATPAPTIAPNTAAFGGKMGGMYTATPRKRNWAQQTQPLSPLSGMVANVYNSPGRSKPTYF